MEMAALASVATGSLPVEQCRPPGNRLAARCYEADLSPKNGFQAGRPNRSASCLTTIGGVNQLGYLVSEQLDSDAYTWRRTSGEIIYDDRRSFYTSNRDNWPETVSARRIGTLLR